MENNLRTWMQRPRNKKRLYVIIVLLIGVWIAYRFVEIGNERRLQVFNPARFSADAGIPVDVMNIKKTTDVLRIPLTVKHNRAIASNGLITMLKSGQRVGTGKIEYVSNKLNLETGMYDVRTRGVSDGLNYVEYKTTGYFVPSYIINANSVYVFDNGIARTRDVVVAYSDADTSVITRGLHDGDMLILSRVLDGQKIQIKK